MVFKQRGKGFSVVLVPLALCAAAASPAHESVDARVRPPVPISPESIVIVVSGTWTNTCVPRFASGNPPFQPTVVTVDGTRLVAELQTAPQQGQNCIQEKTPFVAEFGVGSLDPGHYDLEAVILDAAEQPLLTARSRFEVLSQNDVVRGLTIEPEQPLETENTRLLVWGVWDNSCVPRPDSVSTTGREITLFARSMDFTCTAGNEIFAYSAELGSLEPGDYQLAIVVDDGLAQWTYARVDFNVLPGPQEALLSGRFLVRVDWEDFEGKTGTGTPVPLRSDDTASFWFFDRDNWEMLVKTLDGCGVNGHCWVFASAATDVAFRLSVTDTVTSTTRTYENRLGDTALAVTDTEAFPCD
ncbi:MAG: hypothetical protein AAF690_19010 [Acidobacteriota bacterium]